MDRPTYGRTSSWTDSPRLVQTNSPRIGGGLLGALVLSKSEHLANKTPKKSHKEGSLPFTDKTLGKEFEQDVNYVLQLDLSLKEQGRVKSLWNWGLGRLNIKSWAAFGTSKTLLIYSTDEERLRKPLSFVAAHVIGRAGDFHGPGRMMCIGHFCYRSSHSSAADDFREMFLDLLNQLYEQISDVRSGVYVSKTSTYGIAHLAERFTQAIQDLPSEISLVCTIDSLDHYQRDFQLSETCKWIRRLTGIVGQTNARFKLLLTLPFLYHGTQSLKQYGIPKDNMIGVDGGTDDDLHGLDEAFWNDNPLNWSLAGS